MAVLIYQQLVIRMVNQFSKMSSRCIQMTISGLTIHVIRFLNVNVTMSLDVKVNIDQFEIRFKKIELSL